jgi:[glutamine synthetase] adenylyltransferase / [glutamine synthetase]-adenylyl-L-tyrosine phosphorylase
LKTKPNILSDKFVFELRQSTSGSIPVEDFEMIINAFERELQNFYFSFSTEANLHRIIFSLYDKVSFLYDCLKYPHYIQIPVLISVNSNFLTDVIVRNPEFLYWILNPEILDAKISDNYIRLDIEQGFSRFKTFNAKINYLRTLKRRELLRIGLNDILKNTDVKETTKLLSILAKGINAELFSLCHKEIESKYGLNIAAPRYCLAALGKLGGNELNYSSDIDLILFFDKNSQVKTDAGREYFEILNETTLLYIQNSTALTDKGYIYRVDFRLRPDGRTSPLCRTLKDYLQYYETRGEDWERQMLLKLSFVGGSKKLYNSFNNYIQNFIYPSSFSSTPLAQIAKIKDDIEKKVGETDNVKLFSGGIRDIEFSVQALQLLNGGKNKELRTGNSLTAINSLEKAKLLTCEEADILKSGYTFYRQVEHFLQLMNDRQTHLIPDDEDTLNRLSGFLGFKNNEEFKKKIDSTRKQIREIYDSIIGNTEQTGSSLDDIRFLDRKKALSNFKYLQTGQALLEQKQFDKFTINAFKKIETSLLGYLSNSFAPDSVLENLARIIKARGLPSVWYNEFTDNTFFISFLKICEQNKKAADLLVLDKSLAELLLNRRFIAESFESLDNLSVNQVILILSSQYCMGLTRTDKFSKILTAFLEFKIKSTCNNFSLPPNFFIVGLGSFGSGEMTFNSDIDLVFIVQDLIHQNNAQEEFQKLFNSLKNELKPFDVDSRLRPEGKSSLLVWDSDVYYEYFEKRAQNWELQALTRIRFIIGDEPLFQNFLCRIQNKIKKLDKQALKKDILNMRSKIEKQLLNAPQAQFKNFFNTKRSRGGLTDIEFIFQYYLLTENELFKNFVGKSVPEIISKIGSIQTDAINLEIIHKNYIFLKKLELWIQILFNTNSKILPLDDSKRIYLANIMGFEDIKEFEKELLRVINSNRSIFEKTFIT